MLILCIGCVFIAPVFAALPYSPSSATLSAVPFTSALKSGQDEPGVIAAGLIVISTPPGGVVYVDGAELGITPCTLPGLPSGIHIVTIRKGGYNDWTRSVLIRDRHTVNLNADLVPSQGTPVPTVTPKPTLTHPSITPLGTPIPSFTTYPTFTPGPTVTRPSITPLGTPIPAPSLKVISTPPEGAVYIDGVNRGITPCTITGLSTGMHILNIKTDGYKDLNRIILISSGEFKIINIALVPTGSGV